MEKTMTTRDGRDARLQVPADMAFLPVLQAFVEKAALAHGLGAPEALHLTLAAEEIFAYQCRVGRAGAEMDVSCAGGGYYARVDFAFDPEAFDPRAFNLTAAPSPEDEGSLDEMGLVIASRTVDRFHIHQEEGGRLHVTLVKEKRYPEPGPSGVPAGRLGPTFSVGSPETEEIKLFAARAQAFYAGQALPAFLRFPGKVADMVGSGEYRMAVARGQGGTVGGGILWFWASPQMVEFFGPYVFDRDAAEGAAQALLEKCIGAIARSPALGMFTRMPTGDLPLDQFEKLGSLTLVIPEAVGRSVEMNAYFRQMHEDPGAAVWAYPELTPFLQAEYRRLVLPREIRRVQAAGEGRASHSVLASELDRANRRVTLRPIWSGTDAERNVRDHVQLFEKEALENVFFIMDVGRSWQAQFAPAALACGFAPRLVLPYGGKGDLVVFQKGRP
jgi:anti-sigma regulatory factor (Ser/Thr protein kinase)